MMEPGDDFDPTGFELPLPPEAPAESRGQGQLFADDSIQPDAAEGEPVFWSASSSESLGSCAAKKPDDYVQADAPETF